MKPLQPFHRRRGALGLAAALVLGLAFVGLLMRSPTRASGPTAADKPAVDAAYASLAAVPVAAAPKLGPGASLAVPVPGAGTTATTPFAQTPAGAGTIVASDLGPPGIQDAVFTNDWYETTSSDVVEVYAGHLVSDPTQGVVVVAIWDASHAFWLGGGRYLPPAVLGPVSITGATGETLDLTGQAGSTITFDPRTGTFK